MRAYPKMKHNDQPTWWLHGSKSWQQLSRYFGSAVIIDPSCWNKISHGIANNNYQLALSEKRYFIQVVNQKNSILLPEANNFPNLTQLKNYPRLASWLAVSLYQSPTVRIFEWIDSLIVDQSVILQADYQQSLIGFLAILHSEKIPNKSSTKPTFASLNITAHLSHYKDQALTRYRDDKTTAKIKRFFTRAIELAKDFDASTFCHNDLSLTNQLWNKKSQLLTIVDWEYACFSDPIFELANYFNALQLTQVEQRSFIEKYQSASQVTVAPDIIVDLNKLEKMQELAKTTNFLWDLVAN